MSYITSLCILQWLEHETSVQPANTAASHHSWPQCLVYQGFNSDPKGEFVQEA